MNITGYTDRRFETGGAILVRAPVTPEGSEAYRRTLTATLPEAPGGLCVVAAIYSQSVDEWLADWRSSVGELPAQCALVDVGGEVRSTAVQSSENHRGTDSVSIIPTEPTDTAKLLFTLREQLSRFAATESRVIVSIETLTAFLESVDEETAVRHLHLLLTQLRSIGAVGYFHADPNAHSRQTLDTVSALFDRDVDCAPADHDQPPHLSGDHNSGTPLNPTDDAASPTAHSPETDTVPGRLRERIASVVPQLGRRWLPRRFDPRRSQHQNSAAQPDLTPSNDTDPDAGSISEDAFLTTNEQIYQVIRQHDGRMKQRELVEQTPWSAATVSRALGELEESQQIRRVQIGRGKFVFLADHEPSGIASISA